jgi:hypothetical protein
VHELLDGFHAFTTGNSHRWSVLYGAALSNTFISEIYTDTRAERVAAHGNHSGTIFLAYREMIDARKTTWAGLSRDLADLSLQ